MNPKTRKKILFVCSVNKMRSLTAEKLYETDHRFQVKSAGTEKEATVRINRELIEWADYILVMERKHRNKVRKKFPDLYKSKRIICLYIPDDYDYMANDLIIILKEKMNGLFGDAP